MKPLVSIQILNWNRAEETQAAIQSALNQSYENIEIIIVDNGSTDNSIHLTKNNFPDLKIVELDKNYGCPGGRNLGIPHCTGEFIFFLDNDGVLHKEAIKNAVQTITSDSNIAIVTGMVYEFFDKKDIDPNCEIRNNKKYVTNLFNGGISMHRKSIFSEVGLYPEHFMYGGEESYLAIKLSTTKYKIIEDDTVILWHKGSEYARDRSKETLSAYFNKLYTAIALYPLKELVFFLIYFLAKYPFYAKKAGILKQFIMKFRKEFVSTIRKGLKNRNPIKQKDYNNYKKIDPSHHKF